MHQHQEHIACELSSTPKKTIVTCSMSTGTRQATIKLSSHGDILRIVKTPPKAFLPCLLKSALNIVHQSGRSFKELEVRSLSQSYRDLGFKKRRGQASLFLKLWDPLY